MCYVTDYILCRCVFFQAEDGIRYLVRSRGLGDVYKRQVLAHHGIQYDGRARQIAGGDAGGDPVYLIAMDSENVEALRQRFGDTPHLHRLLDFAGHTAVRDVPDPYYSDNFDYVYRCLLYKSDAADERSRVDLGGCRIIKKKKNTSTIWTIV